MNMEEIAGQHCGVHDVYSIWCRTLKIKCVDIGILLVIGTLFMLFVRSKGSFRIFL